MSRLLRISLGAASAMALLAAAGCSRSELQDMSPPPTAYVDTPQARQVGPAGPTPLLGGPARSWRDDSPLEPPPGFGAMAPIPNPEDMSPDERAQIYGDRHGASAGLATQAHVAPPRASELRQARRARHREPAPSAEAVRPPPRLAAASATPNPPVVASAPAPAAQTAAPTTTADTATTASAPTRSEQLGAAVATDTASGVTLDVPAGLAAGQEGVVVLLLPKTLLERIQAEASKLGLGVASRIVDARAILTGEGYTIVPEVPQSVRLPAGDAATLSWQVKPGPGAKGPLKAQVTGELKGGAYPVTFPLATVEHSAAAASAPAAKAASDADAAPSTVTVPPFGQVRTGVVVLTGLAILALIVLAAILRAASNSRARDRRRRELRTMAERAESRQTAPPVDLVEPSYAPARQPETRSGDDKTKPEPV